MNDLTQSRTASVLSFLLGVWLMLSPIWISITGAALTSLLFTGGVIVAASAVQFFFKNPAPSWFVSIAAIWLFVSVLIYDVSNAVVWNQTVGAVVAFILSLWDSVEMAEVQERRAHTY